MRPLEIKRTDYPIEYFSSADVSIYIGNQLIDELNTLSFQLQENVLPISGYASRTFDEIARGKRQISGNFSINFKSNNYLNKIFKDYTEKKTPTRKKEASTLIREEYTSPGFNDPIEEMVKKSKNKEEFNAEIERLREKYWGAEKAKASRVENNEPYFFDNGGTDEAQIIEEYEELRKKGFTIEIQYGDDFRRDGMQNNEAVRKLYGVQLTGFGQRITLEGQPVREVYSFMAKDLSR